MTVNHQARKRFGQNFLVDQQIIAQIVSAINPKAEDNLIEIGPGMAAITEHLINYCPAMSVLELDRDLVTFLQQKFAHNKQFTVHSGDALKTDFANFTKVASSVWWEICRIIFPLPCYFIFLR